LENIGLLTDTDLLQQCVDAYRAVVELRESLCAQGRLVELERIPSPDELLVHLEAGNEAKVRQEMLQIRADLLMWFEQPGIRELVWKNQANGPSLEREAKCKSTQKLS